jgi:hypothetical protein
MPDLSLGQIWFKCEAMECRVETRSEVKYSYIKTWKWAGRVAEIRWFVTNIWIQG